MAQVLIRDLEPEVVERLRARARANGRSLEAELRALLRREVGMRVGEQAAGYRAKPKPSPAIRPPKRTGPRKEFKPIKLKGKGKSLSELLIEDRR